MTLAIDELWSLGQELFNINGGHACKFEGRSTYFYVDEWIEKCSRYLTRFGVTSDQRVHDALLALSRSCGYIIPSETSHEADAYVRRALVAISLGWNGEASPRELIKQCADVESCAILADYLDERTPQAAPDPQHQLML